MALETKPTANALEAAGLPLDAVHRWQAAEPRFPPAGAGTRSSLGRDAQAASEFLLAGAELRRRLPEKPRRSEPEQAAAEMILSAQRDVRTRFLRAYGEVVYAELTRDRTRFVRAEELVYAAAERFPGLTPTREAVAAEAGRPQKDKDGLEVDQGIFLSQVLALPRAGLHLVHAMLRPTAEAEGLLDALVRGGSADLGAAYVERRGRVGYVYNRNTRYLNAEDDPTMRALETAVDLVLLHPEIEVGVMRGAPVEHPKYAGRRIFNAGLNLTHVYHGKLPYLFFITRDMGYVNKLYRGLASEEFLPGEPETTIEKPWIAAVEGFAIGGGCQLLLVMDHVLAESNTFFSLPARKEGIIPGAANLRLTRFLGDRLTRQAILFDRQFPADTPEGRLLCDRVVPVGQMDAVLEETVQALTTSGVVSAAGNRKAIRVSQEPLDLFRQYMAVYAREQASCHFSPQLTRNLEVNWNAHQRTPKE